MSKKEASLTDQLKAAVEATGLTLYRVAKDAGISYPVLHRFMAGERDLRLATVDKLTKYLKLRLTK